MFPYIVLIGVPALWALFNGLSAKKRDTKNLITFFFIWLTVMLMLRHISCGIDLINYKVFFKSAMKYPFENRHELEWGYHIFESLIALITKNYQAFIAIVAIISMIPVFILYRKESEIPYLTVILFATIAPFSMFFSGLRQTLAMVLVVPAYYCTKNRRPLLFILCVLAAWLFHHSAFILLILYPLYHIRLKRIHLVAIVPAIVLIFIFRQPIFSFLLQFLGERYIERYSVIEETGAYTVFIVLLLFLLYSYFVSRDKDLDYDTIGLRNILFLTVCIQSFASVHALAMRMNYYFLLLIPIIIPRLCKRYSEGNEKLVKFAVVVMSVGLTVAFFVKAYFSEDILQLYPYYPFWA